MKSVTKSYSGTGILNAGLTIEQRVGLYSMKVNGTVTYSGTAYTHTNTVGYALPVNGYIWASVNCDNKMSYGNVLFYPYNNTIECGASSASMDVTITWYYFE